MAYIESTYPIVLTASGGTVSLHTGIPVGEYDITGTATLLASYNITYTGTLYTNLKYVLNYDATITLNGNTLTIFGLSLDSNQALQKGIITAKYNGSAWVTVFTPDFENDDIIETRHIIDNAVTNDKLDVMADQTIKGNVSGGSATPTDIALSALAGLPYWSKTGNSGTTPGTNFVGTTDNQDLVFKANSLESGRINLSLSNTSFGRESLINANTAIYNVAFGRNTLKATDTGDHNSALGSSALIINTSGNSNTSVGSATMTNNTTGSYNTALGYAALQNNTTASYNTTVGHSSASSLTIGGSNTIIGATADVTDATSSHRISLGYGASADADYQFAIPDNVTTIKFKGIVYTLPTVNAAGVLTNDGSGNLSWV